MEATVERFFPILGPNLTINETVEPRTIYYRLGESEVFQYANKNTSLNGGVKLADVLPKMTVEGQGFIRIGYDQLDDTVKYEVFEGPRYKIPCKKVLRDMIERQNLVLVYSEEYRIPTGIPYLVQMLGNKRCRVFVNVTDFVSPNQYGKFKVDHARNYNALMSVIFAGALAFHIVDQDVSLPADIADAVILTYANMLERIINMVVRMDPITREKVKYLAVKFALIQMYGTKKGEDLFYRYQNKYFPKLSRIITDALDAQFPLDCFDKLSLLIDAMKKNYPSMHNLSDYLIYDRWIQSYGSATTLGIDYFGYHLYTICMILFESPLISRMALEPIMEKNRGTELYKRLPMFIM